MPSVLKLDTIKSTTGNEAMTISESGIATFNSQPVQSLPIFSATYGSQTVSSGTVTQATNYSIEVDNYSWWNSGQTRYIPQIPGWYEVYQYLLGSGTTNVSLIIPRIHFNGSAYATTTNRVVNLATLGGWINRFIYFNGSTDYVEFFLQVYGSGTLTASGWCSIKLLKRDAL
jgi:hypothetical protein